ncbi:sugar-binding transcriptional regulator [Clostridium boliviensis]|uniref:Sugar-binding transcriptional regulator n=1 Tax=Clostridium boliviensis TaxID=318465 RepID=A0ABU4GPM4_9CLOT|nr:sugar-binding transcriptional regulator [Clostridium boliviensis]MDW2798177.1 sugar-binding transcriptional regulator [Clostridium boliviensis]
MNYEESLIVKTAWYYYIENMTQQKISERLGISRMKVIKLLDKARQNGVIQFKISQERSHHLQAEQELIKKWNLKDAFVVPASPDNSSANDTVAKAAAMYINDRITDNTYINIGYGDTLSRVLNHLATVTEAPVSAVSLTGGVSYYLPNTFSSVFNAKLYLYPAPLIVSTKELCNAMQSEPSIQEISRMVNLASMTVISIGGLNEDATIIKNGIFTQNDFLYLSMQGAVGDLLSHFIDKDGNPVETDIEERLLSTPLTTLRALPNVIGVAAGTSKVKAIQASLNGGYLNTLITDEATALSLLAEDPG